MKLDKAPVFLPVPASSSFPNLTMTSADEQRLSGWLIPIW